MPENTPKAQTSPRPFTVDEHPELIAMDREILAITEQQEELRLRGRALRVKRDKLAAKLGVISKLAAMTDTEREALFDHAKLHQGVKGAGSVESAEVVKGLAD